MALPGLPKGMFTADDACAVGCLRPAVLYAPPFTIAARMTVHDSQALPDPRPVRHGLPNLKDCKATARSYAAFLQCNRRWTQRQGNTISDLTHGVVAV